MPAPSDSDGDKDRQTMFALADSLLAAHGGPLAAIGISFGGPVDWHSQRVILSYHVPGWEDAPLARMARERYAAPTVMDNDANIAALGEWQWGAGEQSESVFYITVNTGIGGG